MATISYQRRGAYNKIIDNYSNSSQSNKVGHRVNLFVESPHSFVHNWATVNTSTLPTYNGCQDGPATFPFTTKMENEVYNRFIGKLRKGSASLGVTLGSYGQSRDMVVDRFKKLNPVLTAAEYRLRQRRRKDRPKALRARASDVLEVEFGWRPLISDIQACLETVFTEAVPPQRIKVSSKFAYQDYQKGGNAFLGNETRFTGWGRITASSAVQVSNPNLWLANRLGLINPGTVAWDLVPWSFVVNMFVNIDKLIGSISDLAGLTFSNSSITRSSLILREQRDWNTFNVPPYAARLNMVTKIRNRSVGSIPSPSLEFKVPELNWELALIASSLAVQKFRRISELLR